MAENITIIPGKCALGVCLTVSNKYPRYENVFISMSQ